MLKVEILIDNRQDKVDLDENILPLMEEAMEAVLKLETSL